MYEDEKSPGDMSQIPDEMSEDRMSSGRIVAGRNVPPCSGGGGGWGMGSIAIDLQSPPFWLHIHKFS